MVFSSNRIAFSDNGEYFAHSDRDDTLKIWETSSNELKQEYRSSSTSSAKCSVLVWCQCSNPSICANTCKKAKLENFSDLNLIVMGMDTGEIFIYNVTFGELHKQLVGGHDGSVNDICSNNRDDELFSCADDQYIVIWNISTGNIKLKWKTDYGVISSICLIDKNTIITGGDMILLWDVTAQTVTKKFNVHATDVFQLVPLSYTEHTDSDFVSFAIDDKTVNVWQVNQQDSTTNPAASFCLPDEPDYYEIFQNNIEDKSVMMVVVTKDGSLQIFKHMMNSENNHIKPEMTVHIASDPNDSKSESNPVPIIAAKLLDKCIVVYGSLSEPIIEKLDIADWQKNVHLIRPVSLTHALVEDENLEPPTEEFLDDSKHRKSNSFIDMQKAAMDPNEGFHQLEKALENNDDNLINNILQCDDDKVIILIVSHLSLVKVKLLLNELYHRLKQQRNYVHSKWVHSILSVHLRNFITCPDSSECLERFKALLEGREEKTKLLHKLNGCLEMLLDIVVLPKENQSQSKTLVDNCTDSSIENASEDEDNLEATALKDAQETFSDGSAITDSESEMDC